jgi:charged multivesicular body protein 4
MGLWSSLRRSTTSPSSSSTSGNSGSSGQNASLEAINKIRSTLDILGKKEAFLEQRMLAEQQSAVQQAKANRSAALQALQRRKLLEAQCERIRAARFNLELQLLAIENATLNLETMEAMRQGSQAIKALHGAVSVDKVDETMDEIREQMDVAKEIGDAIASPLGTSAAVVSGVVMDEDELDAELEALQQEALDRQLLSAPPVPSSAIPSSAVRSPPIQQPRQRTSPLATTPLGVTGVEAEEEEEDGEEELQRLRSKMALS